MTYDVIVIGGGPAGMMAAGRAGELGVRVVLIEKNISPGVKLLMAGGGRCNLTHFADKAREIVAKFGKNGKFLYSALSSFSVADTMRFFEEKGVELKVEEDGRVFPKSDRAADALNALTNYMKGSQVELKMNAKVKDIIFKNNQAEKIILENGEEIEARAYVICTGGLSYPKSGSTGDGYEWAKKAGHEITDLFPSLVPIVIKENYLHKLEGLSLKNIQASFYKINKKIASVRGAVMFTANGLGGPLISELSREIGKQLPDITLKIDFKPDMDCDKLDKFLQEDFIKHKNKLIKNGLEKIFPPKMISVIINLAGIDPERKVNSITREERKNLIYQIKEFTLNVIGTAGFQKAKVTSGGINLSEVDPKTLKSRLIKNLFFAGEILDLDGETGGYNLQMCWSTGYVAGENAALCAIRSRVK